MNLTQTSGTLRGTGTVTVTGALNWTGGAMLDAGKTRIAASATGTISGGNVKDLAVNRVLENAGTLLVSGGAILFNQIGSFGGGAVINNLAGATLEAQGDVDLHPQLYQSQFGDQQRGPFPQDRRRGNVAQQLDRRAQQHRHGRDRQGHAEARRRRDATAAR